MTINPGDYSGANEESELIDGASRVFRGVGMAGMQATEIRERQRQATSQGQRETEAAEQHQARQGARNDASYAESLHRDAYSAQFWKSTSNPHLARSIVDAQDLALRGHGSANSAFMAFADQVRDRHGLHIEPLMKGGDRETRMTTLLRALDDHNAAGRLRGEAAEAGNAAELVREEQQAIREDEAAYSPALREAAMHEAAEAGLDTGDYLDRLTDEQRASILGEPENHDARDSRIEAAGAHETKAAAGADGDRTHEASHPQERGFDTAAHRAEADAARAHQAARLSGSQLGADMNRHLDSAARKDPQAAAARAQAANSLPAGGKGYLNRSTAASQTPRKAAAQQRRPGREHVRTR